MNMDNLKKIIDKVNQPDNLDFFINMNVDELNEYELMYMSQLQKTESDINMMTDDLYTKNELDDLYNMSNINLNKISKVKQNK